MTDNDGLRASLEQAAVSPTLVNRKKLLDALVDRIDAGGADVADAPAPRPALAVVASAAGAPSRARRAVARGASLGLAGWAIVAAGSAAAATAGAWLLLGPEPEPPPAPVASTSAEPPPEPSPTVVAPTLEAPDLPASEVVDRVVEEVVRDTVGPVISGVSLVASSGPVGDLTCGLSPVVLVTAKDASRVAEVSLRVKTSAGELATVPLARAGGHQWTGLAPHLSLLGEVTVEVVARDNAGNKSTTSATQVFADACGN